MNKGEEEKLSDYQGQPCNIETHLLGHIVVFSKGKYRKVHECLAEDEKDQRKNQGGDLDDRQLLCHLLCPFLFLPLDLQVRTYLLNHA